LRKRGNHREKAQSFWYYPLHLTSREKGEKRGRPFPGLLHRKGGKETGKGADLLALPILSSSRE